MKPTVMTLFLLLSVRIYAGPPVETAQPKTDAGKTALADRYHEAADRIITAALKGNDGYKKLEYLCDDIGHRLSGSPQLEKAIAWAIDTMKADGQENVHGEKVMVPHWVRGRESATMMEPHVVPLTMLGLGGSVATPPEGITAPVVVVDDETQLDRLGEAATGKIVLFNNAMPEYNPETGSGYGTAVRFRHKGAILAAERGAVACLVRSVTARSLRTPHTGGMSYDEAKTKVPAAALTTEDADMIARLHQRGVPVTLNLKMEAKTLPDAESFNVIGELRGSSLPEEIVLIGGHIDSWDVGQGAHDDGGGSVTVMEAIHVLRKLNMIPRRTIRVVLWTNEENGLRGAKAYAADHAEELANHVAAIETDSGVFQPQGFSLECTDKEREAIAAEQMRDIAKLLAPLQATKIALGGSGADLTPLKPAGVVLLGHEVEGSTYFDYHHTPADTFDKIDPTLLSRDVAAMAVVAYVLADMPERLGRN